MLTLALFGKLPGFAIGLFTASASSLDHVGEPVISMATELRALAHGPFAGNPVQGIIGVAAGFGRLLDRAKVGDLYAGGGGRCCFT